MEFGKVPTDKLDKVDFSLPPGSGDAVLQKTGVPGKVYVGCTSWGRKEWIGKLFAPGTKDAGFLAQYATLYNAVELNATHYKIYSPADIQRWVDKVRGRAFRFCPKFPQRISHYSDFKGIEDLTAAFLDGVRTFGEHLGPIFLQVSDQYTPARKAVLLDYLGSLPTDLSFFLEVRHPAWFSDKAEREDLFHRLREMQIGLVLTDAAGRRDVAHMQLTVPKAFIRFVANSLHPTDFVRIDAWAERLRQWLDSGLEELFLFAHMPDETAVPELTLYLVDKLNAVCGLDLPRPQYTGGNGGAQQASLF
ncbi:DUF72 domain-containing protein [Dinghuibacter silviterrae]|uniref:Uncharacterized protein YecE (DUF72 family) n=1 Tax=Dinghuibacter silviterrae TaxID=1539049 RepID=A0A4R8DNR7_9BACT|nr:DUF72 domain-containing protein [Dinghuibacter silviterrae]TDW99709.1 uncharacterized protein YecE (DUF72 family) [Dinghuibacter silviterrae]